MFNTFRSELYRLFKSKMIYVFTIITALLPLLSLLFIHMFTDDAIASGMTVPLYDQGLFFSSGAKELLTGGVGMLFAMLLGVNLLVDEYHAGMLKVRLLSTGRFTLYAAKVLVIAIAFGMIVAVYGVMTFMVGGFYYGFQMDGHSLFTGVLTLVLSFQTLTIVSICFMGFGILFKKASSAIAVGIGVVLVWNVLVQLLSDQWLWLVPHAYVLKTLSADLSQYGFAAMITLLLYFTLGVGGGLTRFSKMDLLQ